MGQGLPKAVTSVAVKRVGGTAFRVGFAEMNGWRPSMEDANVIYAQDTWGFFGVFDGHGGDQCSGFIAKRIREELEKNGMPEDDAAVTALALRLDKEFLALNQPSGSTGTFVIVTAPNTEGGRYQLRVGNIGDSRVLLGRADGSIYPGPGTDSGLTTDHKPDLPSERARIERTGGNVQEVMGVARVNGDLAVSRAFGDAQHKSTGGPNPEDHPVSAAPDLKDFECDGTDFLMLVCDGISEGSFPNEAVIKLAAEKLKAEEGIVDPAKAAIAVCHEAIKCGSKDNLSCMIVLLGGGDVPGAGEEFIPGPFEAPDNAPFRKAYAAMAEHAGMDLQTALEKRFNTCQAELAQADPSTEGAKEMQAELAQFGAGPPEDLVSGSPERIEWFNHWLESRNSSENSAGLGDAEPDAPGGGMTRDQLWEMIQNNPRLRDMAESSGLGIERLLINDREEPMRTVRVAKLEDLKPAVEAHAALKWDDRLADACGCEGIVLKDDESDGTAQVRFPPPLGFKAWLPTSMLQETSQTLKKVKACEIDQLKEAVQAHSALKWDDRLAKLSGEEGVVVQQDKEDATLQVRFPAVSLTAWLPESTLTYIEEREAEAEPTRAESS